MSLNQFAVDHNQFSKEIIYFSKYRSFSGGNFSLTRSIGQNVIQGSWLKQSF